MRSIRKKTNINCFFLVFLFFPLLLLPLHTFSILINAFYFFKVAFNPFFVH